jgi:hypothetical protein
VVHSENNAVLTSSNLLIAFGDGFVDSTWESLKKEKPLTPGGINGSYL